MIKIELICSRRYVEKLNPSLTDNEWSNLVFLAKKFNLLYSKNIPLILEKIPHFTGFDWEQNLYVPIYFADYSGPSRTNPLTIKIDKNENMLVKLIHELTHINFPNNLRRLNESLYEDVINQVSENIARNLNIENCEALEKILIYRSELIDRGLPIKVIPFESVNIKNYFPI